MAAATSRSWAPQLVRAHGGDVRFLEIMKMGQHADIGSGQVTAKVAVKKMGQQIMKLLASLFLSSSTCEMSL